MPSTPQPSPLPQPQPLPLPLPLPQSPPLLSPPPPSPPSPGRSAAGPVVVGTSPRRLRASDAEREQVATILRAAMTEGRLSLQEGEERLGVLYGARFRDELAPLTDDLPDGGRRALSETPQARAEVRRGLRRHAGIVAGIAAVLSVIWVLSGAQFFWPAIPLAFLVMGLARHARYGRYQVGYSYQHRVAPWNGPARH